MFPSSNIGVDPGEFTIRRVNNRPGVYDIKKIQY